MTTHIDPRDALDYRGPAPGEYSPSDRVLFCAGYGHEIRWRPGERFQHLFEERCDRMREQGRAGWPAVDAGEVVLTYDQLDSRANQLARHLLRRGVRPGDRVALLFDEAVHSYVAMLAVLKVNAAYVPLDVGYPADRLAYIVTDAGARTVLSLSHLRDRVPDAATELVCLDEVAGPVEAEDDRRLTEAETGPAVDDLCYIVYTSGSTGRPKGVSIGHASICNFVRVAVEVYGLEATDRVYQGMTIAFDFSVEEIWVPLIAGATLVPKPAGGSALLGHELGEFLRSRRVTALCCVPTLLETLEEDVPGLRFLLVSGEACPQDVVDRWYQPHRRFLNVYGPTEATVTATWTLVHPDRPVTIGVPLPTYSVVILDPAEARALPRGEIGEIGIAGIGLADGYLNRDDLTERAFIPDFLGIGNNPSGRIYRTGDLGRVNDDGEIEYHGRIDTQVKIRGYRIELAEIESVLLRVPGIAQVVVDTHQTAPGVVELVAYYTVRGDTTGPDTTGPDATGPDATRLDQEHLYDQLRERLPSYMVPAYLEELPAIPLLPSNKVDRRSLPAPRGARRLCDPHAYVAPEGATETVLADTLARVMGLDQVSVESHLFDDLGANSLLMARFCARVRQHVDLPPVSMKDVYLHPTVRSLAAHLAEGRPPAPVATDPTTSVPAGTATVAAAGPSTDADDRPVTPVSTARYVLCGALQLLLFLLSTYLTAVTVVTGYEWVIDGSGLVERYLRSVAFGAGLFVVFSVGPIAIKWLVVGRWTPRRIPVWSLAYLRFWFVKAVIRSSPLALFSGSPLYVLYLRALGARIGSGVVLLSRSMPVCTDLLTVGDGTVVRKDAFLTCYRARAGAIETGPVTLGKDVLVGEATVLDIGTSMGDGAQLGHSSALHTGQAVPAGESWHGSPAQRTDADYRAVDPARCGRLRRFAYAAGQVLTSLTVHVPLVLAVWTTLLTEVPMLRTLLGPGHGALTRWESYAWAATVSLVLLIGGILTGLLLVLTVPRVLALGLRPDRTYPLYGFHYWLQRTIARTTNRRYFTDLFGDSSFIVTYLQALGYRLSPVEQTGSNFGMEVKHDTPYLSGVGTGTMVSDGLSFVNVDYSNTSFRLSRVAVGQRNYIGNNITYPARGRVGDNCLLATKVMVPIDGEIRNDVGLLGSPCFEIPRSVRRDNAFDAVKRGGELRRRLAAKNRHNAITILLSLVTRWVHLFGAAVIAVGAADLYHYVGALILALGFVAGFAFTAVYYVLVERAFMVFRPLRPRFCSIYDIAFWRHERYWKIPDMGYIQLLNGTPFKGLIWRALGVRTGRRIFDDGCEISERALVAIGDDAMLNVKCNIQSHSLEEGVFKSDHIRIGAGCSVGINSFLHYGATMGDGAELAADSFLMKGEEVVPGAHWGGNPAQELRGG